MPPRAPRAVGVLGRMLGVAKVDEGVGLEQSVAAVAIQSEGAVVGGDGPNTTVVTGSCSSQRDICFLWNRGHLLPVEQGRRPDLARDPDPGTALIDGDFAGWAASNAAHPGPPGPAECQFTTRTESQPRNV
ncbi:MAG TPA: hypothetical protein VFC19_47300 [Candidatus Limnocylindrales bacterium]|nr:hypothetical protein [Candidatus Limnocylindrales bacterium]